MEQTSQPTEQTPLPIKPEYKDIAHIVEYLVKVKSSSYAFDCYTSDDIGQEIRIICLNALRKYDPSRIKTKIENYFGRCVDNGLKNLKRDNYIRTSSPYKKKIQNLPESDESEEAQKIRAIWAKFQHNIKCQLGIIHAKPISVIGDVMNGQNFESEMEYKDLEAHILNCADISILKSLKLLLAGHGSEVSKRDKKKIQAYVERLLG